MSRPLPPRWLWFAGGVALFVTSPVAANSPPEMPPEAIQRVTEGWSHRVFLVVADGGSCRAGVHQVVQDPSTLFRKRRVGCAVYVGGERRLLTTASVVGRGDEVEIFSDDGKHMLARVVGSDPYLDIALIEAIDDLPNATAFRWPEDAVEPRAGVPCLVLGSAYGRSLSATLGRMGGTIEIEPGGLPVRAHRVLASIFPGDAGGPVLDEDGNFVGLVTGVSTPNRRPVLDAFGEIDLSANPSASAGTVGFAVPARECRRAWDDLAAFGRVRRGYLGIQIPPVAAEQGGVLVLHVAPGGPAARGGILPGDLITTFGGRFISSGKELCALVASTEPRRGVEMRLLRSGHEVVLAVDIDVARERPGLHRIPLPGTVAATPGSPALTPVVGPERAAGR